jgi:hypothetical protein
MLPVTIEGIGKGQLVRTGRSQPRFDVSYKVSSPTSRRPIIDSVQSDDGRQLPMGDWDLIVGRQLIRLRHSEQQPEWLVLSSSF